MGISRNKRNKNNYYFKCSIGKYKAFAMIQRDDKYKLFKLTKLYTLEYYNHSYYIKNIVPNN